jgi:hypothetical protein
LTILFSRLHITFINFISIAFTLGLSRAFANSNVRVLLLSRLVLLAHDANSDLSRLLVVDPDFCSVFDRWRRLRESGVAVDF